MEKYLIIFLHYVIQSPKFTLILTISFIMSVILLCGITLLVFLDKVYRPNIPQYPFNTFFDRIIPVITLILPSIILLLLKPFESWLARLLCLLITHIFVLIPLFHYWSKIRSWSSHNENSQYRPRIYQTISIALVYPLLWGIFLSFGRFLRLGTSINFFEFFIPYIDYMICFCFIIPFSYIWILLIVFLIRNIRENLWSYTETIVFHFHWWALQYYDYFRICQLIHKSHFILFDLFFQYPGAFYKHFDDSNKTPYLIQLTKGVQYLYYNIYICNILFILSIIIELFLNKGVLFYGIYSLFIYPTMMSILRLYHIIGSQDLILNMCTSDYLYQNFIRPRYYLKFWFYANNPEFWYGFSYNLDPLLLKVYNETILLETAVYVNFIKYDRQLLYRVHGYKPNNIRLNETSYPRKYGIKIGTKFPWAVRLAASYKVTYNVRWFHCSRVLLYPKINNVIHPFTAKYLQNPYSVLALLNEPGQSYNTIERLTNNIKYWPQPFQLYEEKPNIKTVYCKRLIDVMETNFVHRFSILAEKNVIIGTYDAMKKHGVNYNDFDNKQQRPDLVSWWANNNLYSYKKLLGIDEKHFFRNAVDGGANQTINSITYLEYQQLLLIFKNLLIKKNKLTPEMLYALEEIHIISKKEDFKELLTVWCNNLHHFPKMWKPPLRIFQTFDHTHLTPQALQLIREGKLEYIRVSNNLYKLQVCTETGKFPDLALDHWEDSDLKKKMINEGTYGISYPYDTID